MLIENGNGTFTAGPLDVMCILMDPLNNTFHPAFLEEAPFPGPVQDIDKVSMIRLKSHFHHTEGFKSFEEAQANIRESFSKKIECKNLWDAPVVWDSKSMIFTMVAEVQDGKVLQPEPMIPAQWKSPST